jgi:hypothetical protein
MSDSNLYAFLENPESRWRKFIYKQKWKYQNSLFPEIQERGLDFEN